MNNYYHSSTAAPTGHTDGFQIGEFTPTTGIITIEGNYFNPTGPGSRNAVVFLTNKSNVSLIMRNNLLKKWGYYTIRCNQSTSTSVCTIENNTFDNYFGGTTKNGIAMLVNGTGHTIRCNVLENGLPLPDNQISGWTNDMANCSQATPPSTVTAPEPSVISITPKLTKDLPPSTVTAPEPSVISTTPKPAKDLPPSTPNTSPISKSNTSNKTITPSKIQKPIIPNTPESATNKSNDHLPDTGISIFALAKQLALIILIAYSLEFLLDIKNLRAFISK